MIGSNLESLVASRAASAISDSIAAVRAVVGAYGDPLSAADVVGVVGQYTGNAAVRQPELETVVGRQQLTDTYDAAFENMRLDPAFRFDGITVKAASWHQGITPEDDHDPHYRRDATSASPAAVRSGTQGVHWKLTQHMYQQSPLPEFGQVRPPLAVAEHDAAPATPNVYLPVQGPCR